MKYILLLVISLVFAGVPAFAQQGGLPALQARINALQAQINALAAPGADAINGTWSGTIRSLGLAPASPSFRIFGGVVPGALADTFQIPTLGSGTCTGLGGVSVPCLNHIGDTVVSLNVNPEESLVKGKADNTPITFTLTRSGPELSGSASTPDGGAVTVVGAVVSDSFFLVKAIAPGPGPCSPGRFQGVASFSSIDPNRLIITGSGIDSDCSHDLFTINLVRQ